MNVSVIGCSAGGPGRRAGQPDIEVRPDRLWVGVCVQVTAVRPPGAAPGVNVQAAPSVRARGGRGLGLIAVAAIALMSMCTYAPTIHLRGHYSDDFTHRIVVQKSGWWGACQAYRAQNGCIRPLGYAAVFAAQQWLWDLPVVQQAVLLGLHVTLCLLAYLLAKRIAGDQAIGLAAAAVLAAWPSYTGMVVWVAGGLQMLSAYVALLAALLLYLRHLACPGAGRWYLASLAVFTVSIGFHTQHLGAVAAFSVLACVCGQAGRRIRLLVGTVPFWLAAVGMALLAAVTARHGERPLEPNVADAFARLGSVLLLFVDRSVLLPLGHCLSGAGPRESISRMMSADPALLFVSVTMLLTAAGVVCWMLRRYRPHPGGGRSAVKLAVVGAVVMLAGLAIMATREAATLWPRHTLLPAIGLSLMLGAAFGRLPGGWVRTAEAIVLAGLLVGLSVFRLGYAYEWTTRTRVTEGIVASLDRLYPVARDGDLLVIDGVRKYGRRLTDSWGLSGALSLRRGAELRVATVVRRDGGRLYANAAWDVPWEIDPAAARFFAWSEGDWSLRPMRFDEFLARHPHLDPGHT